MLSILFALALAHSENWFPVGKDGARTNYALRSACEQAEGQTCYDTAACPVEECSLGQVDDLSRPKFTKAQASSCDDRADCQSKLQALKCDSGNGVINSSFSELYCAVPAGYEKTTGYQRDEAKAAAYKSAQAAAADLQSKMSLREEQQRVGSRLIAFIKIILDEKNLSLADSLAMSQKFAPITGLLQVGSIPSAKALTAQLEPFGPITREDLDKTLARFATEGY